MDKSASKLTNSLQIELFRVNHTRLQQYWKTGILTGTFWCLYWNDAPGAGIIIGSKRKELMPDKLYIIPPDANLYTFCDSEEVSQYYCHFYMQGFFSRNKVIEIDLSPKLEALLNDAVNAWKNMDRNGYFPAFSLITATLYDAHLAGNSRRNCHDHLMEVVRRELMLNLGSPLSVVELAQQYALTEKTFSLRFRNAFGTTPYRYLSLLRYEHAGMQLRNTDASIESISESIGCADRNYFTRCFTRHYGVSPAAYRKRCREKQNS